jgi:hypothetical protein
MPALRAQQLPPPDQLEVTALYQQFLRRTPDSEGLEIFTNLLQLGVPNEVVLGAILASNEYFARP